MCGIAGILGPSAADPSLIGRMTDTIAHRGPDNEGSWSDPEAGIVLGNRRLAIIDLSPAGHQPMISSDGRYVLTFNGEIYNHQELRRMIEDRGHAPEGGWRGHCDTETLLEAVAAWGLQPALERSVGMFALALWDRKLRRLALARDRFGEKPLYYGWVGRDLLFASELKALRLHPEFDGEVDRRALSMFAGRGYVPAPLSIYRGIFKLDPACILTIEADARPRSAPIRPGQRGEGVSAMEYWSYRDVVRQGLANPIKDEREAIDELERQLARAVESQSLADVPVGAFLSGGIDSSAVVALYQKYSRQKVRTFTIGFTEQGFDEAADARKVAAYLGTDHQERVVTAEEALEVIPKLPAMFDEPFADASQIPTYLVSAFAKTKVKVALSGDGGDELFGGYNRYAATERVWSKLKTLPRAVRMATVLPLSWLPSGMWQAGASSISRERASPQFGTKARRALSAMATARGLEDVFGAFTEQWDRERSPVLAARIMPPGHLAADVGASAPDAVRMMYWDATSFLPDDVLCKVDRASMAVSLEVHCPYLDHRVAELAARIPVDLKMRGGQGKHVLRQMLYREAPRELFERPKAGFAVPVGQWLRGPLVDWAEALLDTRRLRSEGWFDPKMVNQKWDQHRSGRADWSTALWSILMFQAWVEGG